MASDLVATFGLDTTEFKRGIDEVNGMARVSARDAGHAGGEEAAHGFGEGLEHAGHAVTRSARAFHHLIFAPAMVAGVAAEALELGEKIGESFWGGFGFAGRSGVEEFEKDLKEGAKVVGESIREVMGKPAAETFKQLFDAREKIAGFNHPAFLRWFPGEDDIWKEHEAGERRVAQLEGVLKRQLAAASDAKAFKTAQEQGLDAVRAFNEEGPARAAEDAERRRDEQWNEQRLEYIQQQEDERQRREEEIFRDSERDAARVWDEWKKGADEASRAANTVTHGASLAAGLYNPAQGTRVFGLGSSLSNPLLSEYQKTNTKIDKVTDVLDGIKRALEQRGPTVYG